MSREALQLAIGAVPVLLFVLAIIIRPRAARRGHGS